MVKETSVKIKRPTACSKLTLFFSLAMRFTWNKDKFICFFNFQKQEKRKKCSRHADAQAYNSMIFSAALKTTHSAETN